MNIGELFIQLGIKGTDKTVSALGDVGKGLKNTASLSLEAKAGIIGAMYALEKLFSASGQKGTDLTNLNTLIGVSTKTLQQYQYAARQVGVSNQEVDGTFKSLQSTMTKTLMGEGAPKGLARVSLLTGGMDANDIKEFAEHPEKLLQKLQEYAQKETNVGLRNETLKSFGVSDNMISALDRNAFRPEVLSKAPTYSDSEIAALDKANVAWSNLGAKIEMAVGHFNALHGGQLVKDISMITDKVLGLAESFLRLADKLDLFKQIGKVFEGWGIIFDKIGEGAKLLEALTSKDPKERGKAQGKVDGFIDTASGDVKAIASSLFDSFKETVAEVIKPGGSAEPEKPTGAGNKFSRPGETVEEMMRRKGYQLPETGNVDDALKKHGFLRPEQSALPPPTDIARPPGAPVAAPQAAPAQNINVNQSLNFQTDGSNAKQVGSDVKKAVRDAFRQMPAQAQGS